MLQFCCLVDNDHYLQMQHILKSKVSHASIHIFE